MAASSARALTQLSMEFMEGCMVYYRQPSIIGGSIVKNVKDTIVAIPKFQKMLEILDKMEEGQRTDTEKPFCSALSKFAGETAQQRAKPLRLRGKG